MSQVKSYEEQYLTKRLVRIHDDLLSLKARQRYGTNAVQTYESNSLTVNSRLFSMTTPDGQLSGTGSGTNIYLLRFTGDKPSKTVAGILNYQINETQSGTMPIKNLPFTYLKARRGSRPNVLEWLVEEYGGNDLFQSTYSIFNVVFTVTTNEHGILEIANEYDMATYYGWILGW